MSRHSITSLASFFIFLLLFLLPFGGDVYFITLALEVLINILVVLGLYVLQGLAGQVSLGQAGFMAIGGYVGAIHLIKWESPPSLELPMVIASTLAVTVIFSLPLVKWRGQTLALGTLAFGYITQLLFKSFEYTGGGEGFGDIPPLFLGNIALDSIFELYFLAWALVGISFYLVWKLSLSHYGRIWLSIKEFPSITPLFGFKPQKYILLALLISSTLAGVAGCLKVHLMNYVGPDLFSIEYSIFLMVMLVIAGDEHPLWACLSAAAFTLIPEALGEFDEFQPLLFSLILIVTILKRNHAQ